MSSSGDAETNNTVTVNTSIAATSAVAHTNIFVNNSRNMCPFFLVCRSLLSRDIRITLLEFIHGRQLLISLVMTLCLTAAVIAANTIERSSYCVPNLKIWIIVITSRTLCRVALQLYLCNLTQYRTLPSSRYYSVLKFIEMLDVFGMVWFAVGNLLVFYSTDNCIQNNPIMYYLCLTYILSMYAMYLFVCLLRANMVMCPSDEILRVTTEMQRLRNIDNVDRDTLNDDPIYRLTLRKRSSNMNDCFTLNEEETEFWRVWLCSFDCYEAIYSPEKTKRQNRNSIKINNSNSNNNSSSSSSNTLDADKVDDAEGRVYTPVTSTEEERASLEISDSDDYTTCAVCLGDFADSIVTSSLLSNSSNSLLTDTDDERAAAAAQASSMTIVVEYPCAARHLFHPACLHLWLHSAGCRGSGNINCPICRQKPHVVGAKK